MPLWTDLAWRNDQWKLMKTQLTTNYLPHRPLTNVVNTIMSMCTFAGKWLTVHMTFNGGSAGSLQWRGEVSEKTTQTFDLLWYIIIVRMFPVCISFPVLFVFKLVHVKEIQKYYFIYVVSLWCAVITNSRRPPSRQSCDQPQFCGDKQGQTVLLLWVTA